MRGRSVLLLSVALVAIAAVVGLALLYSGVFYVGADRPGWAAADWLLETASERSAKRHARGIQVPPLDDAARIQAGFNTYSRRCAFCHGAPGVSPGDVGRGLQPSPPDLAHEAEEMSPAELFWFTKHGIRMTGMPAWGVTQSDDTLWSVVAFMRQLPNTTPEAYQELMRRRPQSGSPPSR